MSDRKNAIVAHLESTRKELMKLIESAPATAIDRPAYEDGWSAREMLAHLVTIEPRMCATVRKVVAGESIVGPPDFSIHRWNAAQVEKRRGRSLDELLGEFNENRLSTLRLVESLQEADLDRRGQHQSWGEVTAEFILRRIGQHEVEHGTDIIRGE